MNFDDENLIRELETCSDEALDAADFGVVAMSPDGNVVAYNEWESKMGGLTPSAVIGRHFFQSVAPCTNNFMVAHRFETEAELDAILDYTFTYRVLPTKVRLRLLRTASAKRMYLLVERRE